jgi:hypothetical protein
MCHRMIAWSRSLAMVVVQHATETVTGGDSQSVGQVNNIRSALLRRTSSVRLGWHQKDGLVSALQHLLRV